MDGSSAPVASGSGELALPASSPVVSQRKFGVCSRRFWVLGLDATESVNLAGDLQRYSRGSFCRRSSHEC
jgi:hypothetical protein